MKDFILGIISSLATSVAISAMALVASPSARRMVAMFVTRVIGSDVERVFASRAQALPEIQRELNSARSIRLLAGRGNELQRETFEGVLFKRPPHRAVQFRVLMPAQRTRSDSPQWIQIREDELAQFDPSFRSGMLSAQVEANVRFLAPYVERGLVEVRRYNVPHVGRILLRAFAGISRTK